MSPRRYRVEQWLYACVLSACGLAVGAGIVGRRVTQAAASWVVTP